MSHPICGIITTELQLPTGEIIARDVRKNIITDGGIAHMLGLFVGSESTPFTYMQIGTGARVVDGENIPNPDYDDSIPESPTNLEYLPVGKAKVIAHDRTALFTFYAEQEVARQFSGGVARFLGRFEIPVDVAINEAAVFTGATADTPVMLNMSTFVDTVQRIRMTGATPTTPTIFFNITWDIVFSRYPFDKGSHELETDL